MPCTSATRARLYKNELKRHAVHTGFPEDVNLDFLCHDFSMRGMAGLEAAIISGMAHMTSFVGSETIPAIAALEEYYGANSDNELIAATVPATEHSVMCAGGEEDELQTFTFIDDLCDAGGTFLGELKVLKERYPDAKYEIMVCHAVNIKGLVNLCNNFVL